jgi:tRNA A-37 threonylcarbamoyl transferase component Bud32
VEEKVSFDSLEGRNLGKYRVLEPLGRGGMARVYRAYHPQLDRYVAIKVLRSDLVEEGEFLARFRREAQAVAALRHPNVVQVFDFDVQDGVYYMVMELLEGDTLRTRLNDHRARGEEMPLGEMVRILLDMLAGLAYAHSEGMIHRDVKPANVLLTRRGQAVLTDFGIAQIVGATRYTVSGALMGTLNYMSPEQGLEGQCDARSDIYSTGIVLYEMLAGEPPYDAETPLAILMKHVNDPLPVPRKVNPAIPKHLERVVLKALAKRREARYQSAEEMATALQRAAHRAGIKVPPRISLPFSFTTSEAPSESVAVLSGTARERVHGADFATEDTEMRLSQRLAAEAAAQEVVAPGAVVGRGALAGSCEQASPGELEAGAVHEGAHERPQASTFQPAQRRERGGVGMAIVTGMAILAIGNLALILVSLVTGWWGIFGRGWPFELLLVGLALSLIMEASGSPWMLIPTGIVLGNGYLFAFYSITNAWSFWAFLWPLEPLLIIGSVLGAIWLSNQGAEGRRITRRMAYLIRRPTVVALILVVVLGAIFG